MFKKILYPSTFFLLVIVIFRSWFSLDLVTAGDFWPYYQSMYSLYSFPLQAWHTNLGGGLGAFAAPFLWIIFNVSMPITILGEWLKLPWVIVERLYYLFPFLIISLISSAVLYRKLISKGVFYLLSASIFIFNTYALMFIGGGQVIGIAMAYAIGPIILSLFIDICGSSVVSSKKLLILGLILAIQAIFDIRILYVTIFALVIYFFVAQQFKKPLKFIFSLAIPFILLLLLNSFWILPAALVGQNPIEKMGPAYSSIEAVRFFSFAKLERTFSLLHPYWPENIFGKVSFMKPEFLILPILAYASLLFMNKREEKEKRHILYFALLGLIGSFLAKGTHEPAGILYIWLFEHFPGFSMFRDSSKWYTLVAISYSILIPYTLANIYNILKSRSKFSILNSQFSIKSNIINFHNLFTLLVISYLLFLIRPALLGQLGGTFKSTAVPPDYIKFEKYISEDKNFYRTLWIPQIQRFAFFSNIHPAIPANDFFKVNSAKENIEILKNKNIVKELQDISIKYVIVPYDSMGEIFLDDRKYNEKIYLETIEGLGSIHWLKRTGDFGKIAVFAVPSPKDHFWSSAKQNVIDYEAVNPTKYFVSIKNANKHDNLVFAEGFDKNWIAKSDEHNIKISSQRYNDKFNSFILPRDGNIDLEVYYEPQKWVDLGTMISAATLVLILAGLVLIKKQ